jgi:penicillin-binding protein 1A
MKSRNLVSIRLLDLVGIPYTVKFIERFGFKSEQIPKTLSLALGTASVTPLQLTVAYATFANGGFKIDPYIIEKITDSSDKLIAQSNPPVACDSCDAPQKAKRVISAELAYMITTVLKDVIQHGTATAAKVLARADIAGKTGTTNDQVDAWFAGFNSNLVATAWMGFDLNKSLHEYSVTAALPMWIDFMRVALAGQPEESMAMPEGIVTMSIDSETGALTNADNPDAVSEIFMKEHLPTEQGDGTGSTDSEDDIEQPLF